MFSLKMILTSITISFITLTSYSQIGMLEDLSANNPYLGYPKPGTIPEIFAPDFISTQYAEFAGTFSPDFTEYYFTRRGPFSNGLAQIMVSIKADGSWSTPVVVDFSSSSYEFEPYITPDGSRLYFGSRRSIDGTRPPGTMHQWYLEKTDSVWSAPKLLGSPFFNRMVMYPSVSNNNTFYFTGLDGIYYSELIDGVYQGPVKLGTEINFLPLTAHSYIAPDESYLIFDGQPRGEGKTDIFISYKKSDGTWTKGKFMGKDINSGESQAIASVSPDGECLFFTRNEDIYWVNASIIDSIKYIPEVTIDPDSGNIPLTVKFSADLNTVPDSITVFEWDLNNDGVIDSRLQNPEFTYTKPGVYSVMLTVFTSSDSASKMFTDAVKTTDVSTGLEICNSEQIISKYALYQNYPNPFNPSTTIEYSILPVETGHARSLQLVNIVVHDILGRDIEILADGYKRPGNYKVNFDGSGLPSGVYIYTLSANGNTISRIMQLLK